MTATTDASSKRFLTKLTVIATLGGRELTEHEATEAGLWRTVFMGDRDYVMVLFASEEGQRIPYVPPARARVTDMFGQTIEVTEGFEIGWDPVFVEVER